MSMDRPQYGEYATPEQQRLARGVEVAPGEFAPAPPAAPAPRQDAPAGSAPAGAKGAAHPHPIDRIITLVLLGVGLVNVLSSIPGFLDLGPLLTQTIRTLGGEGEFSNFSAARTWGIAAAVILLLGYAFTALLAFRLMGRGSRTWWVPVAGFVVTSFAVGMCLSVPLMGDPAFLSLTGG